jgi:hypothetical protein
MAPHGTRQQDLIAAHILCCLLSAAHSHPQNPAPSVAIMTGPTQSQVVIAIGSLTALLAALNPPCAKSTRFSPTGWTAAK